MFKTYTIGKVPILLLVIALFCDICSAQPVEPPLPKPNRFINDYAGVLDQVTKDQLETKVQNLRRTGNIEFGVAIVKTTGGQDIFDYSLALARGWGVGSASGESNGLLLCIAIDDRSYFIQVSRHLEGDLPDGLTGEINRAKLVPAFKMGNYAKGIQDTVDTYIATLAEKRGFSVTGVDQAKAFHPASSLESGAYEWLIWLGLIGAILLLVWLARRSKMQGPSDEIISIFDTSPRGSSSYWSSGPSGSDSGSSDGGSSFGGGGDFGGGGSGGKW